MPFNTAAWIPAKRAPLVVKPAPYTQPGQGEVVVMTRAIGINTVDWIMQRIGDMTFTFIKYPFILGSDVAGEVVEVGAGVTRFKVGDRVVGHALGSDPKRNRAAEGGFQAYAVLLEHMTSAIPDSLSYERAAVIPLGASTAACGLFQQDHLALDPPTVPPRAAGKTLLIWGGSTSVGSNAIQLAVAAGYAVITTASPKNFDYVRGLGASGAFDYNSPTVVKDIVAACKGKTLAGALAIGDNAAAACLDVVHRCQGAKIVSIASFPLKFDDLPDGGAATLAFLGKLPRFITGNLGLLLKSRMRGIRTASIFGSTLHANAVGPMIYADFLPGALAAGQFVPAPEPVVVGSGLAYVQAGLDALRRGVSAKKVVVSL